MTPIRHRLQPALPTILPAEGPMVPAGLVVPFRAEGVKKGRFLTLPEDKLRGGYYTPGPVAAWMCRWAIRASDDRVLEPSCGDGAFLLAAAERLRFLGAGIDQCAGLLHGIELVPAEAHAARQRLTSCLNGEGHSEIDVGDFFDWWIRQSRARFTTIIGNPPFIRYQSFPEPSRGRAMEIMTGLGLRPNRLTNIWVPFVAAAADLLVPGGRMAMIVPAELLQVSYAAQLRRFLTERFAHIDIVTCNELFFDGAEQEVVLLLASGALANPNRDNRCRVAVTEIATINTLLDEDPILLLARAEEKDVRGRQEKWLKYFLATKEIDLLRTLRDHPRIVTLGRLAEVDVGIVTGANAFFVLRGPEIDQLGLRRCTRRVVSKSAHIRGGILSDSEWHMLSARGERVYLVDIRANANGRLPPAAAAYVADGEEKGFQAGYKCSIRKPWYHLPAVWAPDAFLFRQIHDFPRLVVNAAGATATDTVHRVRVHGCKPDALAAGIFTHLTAASAEIEGRSYGGGVLELEPTEAERLLVPDAAALGAALPVAEGDAMIRAGRLNELLTENDRRILRGTLGLSEGDCTLLRTAWDRMRGRRTARGRR